MGKSKTNFDFEGIKSDIQKYANSVCRYAAGEIADELTKSAMLSIAAFYSDYSPDFYNRHYYNFMDRSYRRYYSNPHNRVFRGGVELTPDALDDIYQKGYTTAEVFSSVMESGSHGPELYTSVRPMSKSPIELIKEDRDRIAKNIEPYISNAKKKAQQGTYKYLRFE